MTSLETAKEVLESVLEKMGFEAGVKEVKLNEKDALEVESDSHKLLIGKKGENLRALEHLVNSIARKKKEDYSYVVIDIAGYKSEKEARLRSMALEAADQAIKKNQEIRLKPMNSYERRIVHTALAQMPEIETRSEGEEPYRKIVVSARRP